MDVNDNSPNIFLVSEEEMKIDFESEQFRFSSIKTKLSENLESKPTIAEVRVTDADSGANGNVTCKIISETEYQRKFYKIEAFQKKDIRNFEENITAESGIKSPFYLERINEISYYIKTNVKFDRENFSTISCDYLWNIGCKNYPPMQFMKDSNPSVFFAIGTIFFVCIVILFDQEEIKNIKVSFRIKK